MSIVSILQELTKGEEWGNKEQFERNYHEGKQVLNDLEISDVSFQYYDNGQSVNIYIHNAITYSLNYTTFYDVKFITSIYSKDGLKKEYPFSYDSEICKELERKRQLLLSNRKEDRQKTVANTAQLKNPGYPSPKFSMNYNYKRVSLVYSTNEKAMEKFGRKLGFSHIKGRSVYIDVPLRSADLAYGSGKMMFVTENGESLCITALSSMWRKNACSVITENSIYVFEMLE